ncbi:MAG: CoA-transferase, partial [Myxococcales bacterium]
AYRDFVIEHGSDWSGRWPRSLGTRDTPRAAPESIQQLRVSAQGTFDSRVPQSHLADAQQSLDAQPSMDWSSCSREVRATLLAARAIVRRVTEDQVDTILAGIGQSFAAARLAQLLLLDLGYAPEIVVETGLSGFDAASADPFLLGYRNIVGARRLTDVEHVLGAVVCGNAGRCLAVIGAAQVDKKGRINSTRTGGSLLVGSGGANDIASAADEVVVLVRAQAQRLPENVEFVTSPGTRVRSIVSEGWEIARANEQQDWTLRQWIASSGSEASPNGLPNWCIDQGAGVASASGPTHRELESLLAIGLAQDERSGARLGDSCSAAGKTELKRQHG